MTFFQFSKGVSDSQAWPALDYYPVWQSALFVSQQTVEFMPLHLCRFRASFGTSRLARRALELAQQTLTDAGLLPQDVEASGTADIVNAVCLINHLGSLLVAMNEALEAVAAVYPEWLQQIMRPHWIERYPWQKQTGLPVFLDHQAALASTVGDDILYLFTRFEQEMDPQRPFPTALSLLKKLFLAQFTASSNGFYWTPQPCAYCTIPLSA